MHKILIENARFHAHHGLFDEETKIGGLFEVNLELETDFTNSMKSDELIGTIDYSKVYEIINDQMKIPSKLLEHLANRIIDALRSEFSAINHLKLKIRKLNPPIAGEIEAVSIVIEE